MLTVEALSSSYGRIMALREVSLEVKAGEIVALVGSNGAGKTTLLRAISGVQPVRGGRILFEGEAIEKMEPHLRVVRGISQSPEGRQVFGPLSIEDNLKLGAYRRQDARRQARLDHVYGLFPVLAERRRTPAMSLSGGQQQMLAIGRALMAGPKLLLLDEPSLGLAPLLVDQILAAVTSLRTEGITTLLVEQNASAALAIADRGYVLETGHITMEGTGAALLDDPKVRAAYLGL
ncbi:MULTISPECIES: ABC transporter ATP-binding protein [Xanthobacter]|uniref:ABC transporter ATP-binding protein n=1 Tax=Xanthobacter flavus TaxID=281 RepID=A0A9W6CQZ2_XANFL|nr:MULTISPECIES: ABC transporter ATP-binding protein [Xanthobacter]MDR6336708.1 branched-chain amino acid transport system ATP-binding protein [Xanthobacter flavus]UDQ90015.1 ABC transporter ATP-binding protein [Xanthobacter autotrophicus]UJX46581.1 ABC transporter ATP-binding protein [Xanthobacter sp. YC-JY1]GLI25249.1 ABC transporter ATP-binding protein [Xanthobacter flavus]